MGKINIDNQVEPLDLPSTGKTFLYVDSSDLHLKQKDDTGNVIDLTQTTILSWKETVKDFFDPTPGLPSSPSVGDRYISSETANGWITQNIYEWTGVAWSENIPTDGSAVIVSDPDPNQAYVFDGTLWQDFGSISNHNELSGLQGGTTDEYYHLTLSDHNALTDVNAQLTDLHTDGNPTFNDIEVSGDVVNLQETSYIRGRSDDEGSFRFSIDEDDKKVLVERRTDGVWNKASIKTGGASVFVGENVGIQAVGHFLATETAEGNHIHLHAHSEFVDGLSSSDTKILNAYNFTIHRLIQPDNTGSFTGTDLEFIVPSTKDVIIHKAYFQTGTIAATKEVKIEIWKGTDDTGALVLKQAYPSSLFAESIEAEIIFDGFLEFDIGVDYFFRITSESNFSLKMDTTNTVPWLAADESDVRLDDLLQTIPWVSGETFTIGDWTIQTNRIYVCNTDGIQNGTFASNIALWDELSSNVNSDIYGGTDDGDNLFIHSTSHTSKGIINIDGIIIDGATGAIAGGTSVSGDLTLYSTTSIPKGNIYFGLAQESYFDENNQLLYIDGSINVTGNLTVEGDYRSDSNQNISIGTGVLASLTSGFDNTVIGDSSGASLTAGWKNTLVGVDVMPTGTDLATRNTMIGYNLGALSIGSFNTIIGIDSFNSANVTQAANNTILGYNSGNLLTSGERNLLLGHGVETPLGTSSNYAILGGGDITTTILRGNVGIGTEAPTARIHIEENNSGGVTRFKVINTSTGVSSQAGFELAQGSNSFTQYISGDDALKLFSATKNSNVLIVDATGSMAINSATIAAPSAVLDIESTTKGVLFPRMTTTQRNAIINPLEGLHVYDITLDADYLWDGLAWRKQILEDASGIIPIIVTGATNILGDEVWNVKVGNDALSSLTTGEQNTAIGAFAGDTITEGDDNVLIGYQAGQTLTTGDNNVLIGSSVQASSSTANNECVIGNSSITKTILRGSVGIGTLTPDHRLTVKGGEFSILTSGASVISTLGAVFGTLTFFTTEFIVGSAFRIQGTNDIFTVTAITNDTNMLITPNPSMSYIDALLETETHFFDIENGAGTQLFNVDHAGNSIVGGTLLVNEKLTTLDDALITGDLGVGINSPEQKVHVFKDVNGVSRLKIQNPNTGTLSQASFELQQGTSGAWVYYAIQGSDEMKIFSQTLGGNVATYKSDGEVVFENGGLTTAGATTSTRFFETDCLNVVKVFEESDLPDSLVNGTHYVLHAPITVSTTKTFPTGGVVAISTNNILTNVLTFSGTGTLFDGTNIGLVLLDIQIDSSSTGTLFGISGAGAPALFIHRSGGIDGWDDIGTITNFGLVVQNSLIIQDFSSGLSLVSCTSYISEQCTWFNSSDQSTDFLTFDTNIEDINILNVSYSPFANERVFNINSSASVSAFINLVQKVSSSERYFNVAGLDKKSPGVICTQCANLEDSTTTAELNLIGNTTATDIPAVGAMVALESVPAWTSTGVERLTIDTNGRTTYLGIRPSSLKLDCNINLQPATASKSISIRTVVVAAEEFGVTFTNATNLINETATALSDGDLIDFRLSAGVLPDSIRPDIVYFVVNKLTNSFQVSYTQGGSAIEFTNDGSGTRTYRKAELHGSIPTNTISSGSSRDLIPQALVPVSLNSDSFLVVINNDDSVNITVNSGYQRYFE